MPELVFNSAQLLVVGCGGVSLGAYRHEGRFGRGECRTIVIALRACSSEHLLNCRGVRRVGDVDLLKALLKSSALPDNLGIGTSCHLELPVGLSQLLPEGGFNVPWCMWWGIRDTERDRPIGSRFGVCDA